MSATNFVDNADAPFDGEVIPPSLAIKAMRDSGYKNTSYALAELIDNSIQAQANSVEVICAEQRVLINERERTRLKNIAVLDNGTGMDASTLRLALQFGNGTHLNDRNGIGRFGMGLPNASISQCRRVDVWTWTAGPANAIHTYLDISEIEEGQSRIVPTPAAARVPDEWQNHATSLGQTGTLVVWSQFEDHRLTWKTGKKILEHTEGLVGRMYRKFINRGDVEIRLAVLSDGHISYDERARANDPLYLMSDTSTPSPFDTVPMFEKFGERDAEFEIELGGKVHTVFIRLSLAKRDTHPGDGTDRGRTVYGRHAGKNIGVSIVRAGRELELDSSWAIGYDPRERWWGAEIEFPPALDEIFGVTNNKQAATVFSHMAKFDWKAEAEPGETYMEFKRRLQEDGDTRYALLEIVNYLNEQLALLRNAIAAQGKGRGSAGKRHDDTSVEDAATTKWKERAEQGYKTETDDETFDEDSENTLYEDLVQKKKYDEEVAREIAKAVVRRQRKVIFVDAEQDSQAFFGVEVVPGGVTEIVFNSRHPVYDKLIRVLDTDTEGVTDRELVNRIHNASDTMKLLFAAWARYEAEDIPSRETIRGVRHEWGTMAQAFLRENED